MNIYPLTKTQHVVHAKRQTRSNVILVVYNTSSLYLTQAQKDSAILRKIRVKKSNDARKTEPAEKKEKRLQKQREFNNKTRKTPEGKAYQKAYQKVYKKTYRIKVSLLPPSIKTNM